MIGEQETTALLPEMGHEANGVGIGVGIIGALFNSCMQLLKLSLLKAPKPYLNKTSRNSLEDSMSTLFCWGDELGVPRGDLDDALQYSEETRDLTLAVLISLGEFLSHDLIRIISQPDREEILHKCQISEQLEKAKGITTDWEDTVFEDGGNVEDLSAALKAEIARLSVLGQILEDPVPTFVDIEEARAIGLLKERSAHQYYADMISARFPEAKSSLTEILGKCNWVRYNRIQKQREENTCSESIPAGDSESKSRFQDSGLGTSIPAQSHDLNKYAETIFSERAERTHKRLPPLPEEGRNGKSFVCSVCSRTVNIQRSQAWKKHVFTDILAYVCIFDNCPFDRDFFENQDAMTMHLGLQHGFAEQWQSQECPLCFKQTGSGRDTVSLHFSRHMEEIALGVLPCTNELDEESDTSSLPEENISRGSKPLEDDGTKARSDTGIFDTSLTPSTTSTSSGYGQNAKYTHPDGSLPLPSGADDLDESRTFINENTTTEDLTNQMSSPPLPSVAPFNDGSNAPPSKHANIFITASDVQDFRTQRKMAKIRKKAMDSFLQDKKKQDSAAQVKRSTLQSKDSISNASRSSTGSDQEIADAVISRDEALKIYRKESKKPSSLVKSKSDTPFYSVQSGELRYDKLTAESQQADEGRPPDLSMTAKQTLSEQESSEDWSILPPIEPVFNRDTAKHMGESDVRGRTMINPRDTDDPFPFAGDRPSSPLSSTGGRGLSPSSTGRDFIYPSLSFELGNKPSTQGMSSTQGLSTEKFTCDHPGCNAPPFQTQYLLNSHANVHAQTRPFYCPVVGCPRAEGGKGFKRKNEMIRHGLVHANPGYVCPFCPDREHKYPRPDNLQRHVRVHHPDRDKNDPQLIEVLAQDEGKQGYGRRRRVE